MVTDFVRPLVAFALVFGVPARADEPDMGARQTIGLFMQACVSQLGDILAVRTWLEDRHVPHMAEGGALHFLDGKAGVVFDASNKTGRYGLTTLDNGLCDVFADRAKASDVIPLLEATLKAGGLTVIRLKDDFETEDTRRHHYDYLVIRDGVNYNLVATVSDATDGLQAQLAFWRRGLDEPLPTPLPAPR